MTIDEAKTEVRKIEKYYDFNHQTNDYDVLVNITEIANLILLKNKISYNKAIDDFVNACKRNTLCQTFGLRQCDIEEIAEQLKAGGKNEQSWFNYKRLK